MACMVDSNKSEGSLNVAFRTAANATHLRLEKELHCNFEVRIIRAISIGRYLRNKVFANESKQVIKILWMVTHLARIKTKLTLE